MKIMTGALFLNLTLMLIIIVSFILLQIFLSKQRNKWAGLIFPILSFLYSLLMVFSLASFETMKTGEMIVLILSTFFFSNIPTILFLTIYFVVREKRKEHSQVKKMNIKDL